MQASDQAITYGRHIRALAILGIPIIVGQLGTIIQGLADTIMVGHFSAHSLAAAGFVNNIMVLVLIFALGYSYAITPVIGPMHARGEFENAGKALKAGLQVNGALGMVLFLLMGTLYFFLGHMGQPEELLPEIRPYYIVVVLSIPIQSLFNAFKQFFDSIGNTRTPMWIMISANLFNIVGNYLLIYGIGPCWAPASLPPCRASSCWLSFTAYSSRTKSIKNITPASKPKAKPPTCAVCCINWAGRSACKWVWRQPHFLYVP